MAEALNRRWAQVEKGAIEHLAELIRAGRLRGLRTIIDQDGDIDYETLGTWDRSELIYMQRVILATDDQADREDRDAELALLRQAIEEG